MLTGLPRTIRRHELRLVVPLADSTIYEMEQCGELLRRFSLSPRYVVWDLEEVEAWLVEGEPFHVLMDRCTELAVRANTVAA